MISCGFCEGSCYVTTFYVGFVVVLLMSCWLCTFSKKYRLCRWRCVEIVEIVEIVRGDCAWRGCLVTRICTYT